jgi:hypothetical protein
MLFSDQAEQLYATFPQFPNKDDKDLFEYLKHEPELENCSLLVCEWVDAELQRATGHGLPIETTLEEKKAAIGASLVGFYLLFYKLFFRLQTARKCVLF